ncbi:MAG TPA: hypothetical protein VKV15_26770 [Bryobacteraceae bacterium]|nr:hypothetical protein [Bryobacteraceae bacterium]
MSTPPQYQELIAVSSRPMRDSDLVETRKIFSRGADFALIFMVRSETKHAARFRFGGSHAYR